MARKASTRKCRALAASNLESAQVCPGGVGPEVTARRLEPGGAGAAPPRKWGDFLLGRAWLALQVANFALGQPRPLAAGADSTFVGRVTCQGKPKRASCARREAEGRLGDARRGLLRLVLREARRCRRRRGGSC